MPLLVVLLSLIQFRLPNLPPELDVVPLPDTPSKTVASHTSPIVVPPDVSSVDPSVHANAQPGVPSTTLPIPQPVAQPHLAPSQGLRRSTSVTHPILLTILLLQSSQCFIYTFYSSSS